MQLHRSNAVDMKECHLHQSRFHLLFAISRSVVLALNAAASEVQHHSDQQHEGDGLQCVPPVLQHTCGTRASQVQRCCNKMLPCSIVLAVSKHGLLCNPALSLPCGSQCMQSASRSNMSKVDGKAQAVQAARGAAW